MLKEGDKAPAVTGAQISRAAASTCAACPLAWNPRQTLRSVPSVSIRNVLRLATPTMGRATPNAAETV